jgi:hypothetical protein
MDTSNHHNLQSLFEQLGLPADTEQINQFIKHHPLDKQVRIEHATFWTPAQAAFIQESISNDSDWVELVDHLDVQLRQ